MLYAVGSIFYCFRGLILPQPSKNNYFLHLLPTKVAIRYSSSSEASPSASVETMALFLQPLLLDLPRCLWFLLLFFFFFFFLFFSSYPQESFWGKGRICSGLLDRLCPWMGFCFCFPLELVNPCHNVKHKTMKNSCVRFICMQTCSHTQALDLGSEKC